MGKEKLTKFVDDLLANKRDMVFAKIDQVTNNIILQLEDLKALDDFPQFDIPPDLSVGEGSLDSIKKLHGYIKMISLAANQLELITKFLEGINQFCSRAALFLLRDDKLVGWKGKGFSGQGGEIGDDDIKKIFFSLSANTIFKTVLERRKTYIGDPNSQPDDHLVYSRFGGDTPDKIFALPFFVKGKPQAVVYTDSFNGKPIGVKEIEMVCIVGEMSLDLLPLRQKLLAKVKTQEYDEELSSSVAAAASPAEVDSVPVPPPPPPRATAAPTAPEPPPYEQTSGAPADDQTLPSIRENDPERLARVIVNDIYLYNKDQIDEVLRNRENLYQALENTIMQSRELYLNKFSDLTPFEKQLIETLAKGDKDALRGYSFEAL